MSDKKYFYGIKGIEFVWNGEWNDPTIIYKGKTYNYYMLENTLFDMYVDDNPNLTFIEWMALNEYLAFEILELC